MKAYLVKASAPGPFKEYKKAMGAPPQNIFSVAAATPEGVELELCDETIGMRPNLRTKAGLVALFFHTPDAAHAYRLAARFKARGKTVILGGLHPSLVPGEAARHCDAVLVGEAEGVWEDLLRDFERGALKDLYRRDEPVDLAAVNPYPTDLIPPSKYKYFWSVLVSRGCVHRCAYCAVPPFFRGQYRLRPVANIVEEIKAAPRECWFELHADNLTANRRYALELFNALKPLNINWVGEATIKLADDPELLRAAAESGCKSLLVGIETPSQAALSASGKGFVEPEGCREALRRFHDHGISITSSMIFGFDTHTPEIFRESADFCRYVELDEVESVLLIPFPGTPLYTRLKSENRITTDDWSLYDGNNAVFKPKNMSPEDLEAGATWFWNEIRKKRPSGPPSSPDQVASDALAARTRTPRLTTGRAWTLRWKSFLALGLIAVALVFDLHWVWGVFFLLWAAIDLRSGYTYLMEDIPKTEAPILYWTIVLMWISAGVWTLIAPPASYWKSSPADWAASEPVSVNVTGERAGEASPAASREQAPAPIEAPLTPSETTAQEGADQHVFRNTRFGFALSVPEGWDFSEDAEEDSVTFHAREKNLAGTLSVVAVNLWDGATLAEFAPYMEAELAGDLPFVTASGATPVAPPVRRGQIAGLSLAFREYRGDYQGYASKALIGYGIRAGKGYALIGVYGATDSATADIVHNALQTFSLSGSETR